jgi:hypothetical protein
MDEDSIKNQAEDLIVYNLRTSSGGLEEIDGNNC